MRMQLYKMELYKIFHRKIFWIGILAILGLMFVYFWFAEVGDERCVIDGRSYSGYEAVQMNKKITEEYAGTVTDEKINQIVDKYGLPSELNENMPGWKNGNYNSGGEKEGYFSQSSGFFYDNSSVICRNYRKCMGIMQNHV